MRTFGRGVRVITSYRQSEGVEPPPGELAAALQIIADNDLAEYDTARNYGKEHLIGAALEELDPAVASQVHQPTRLPLPTEATPPLRYLPPSGCPPTDRMCRADPGLDQVGPCEPRVPPRGAGRAGRHEPRRAAPRLRLHPVPPQPRPDDRSRRRSRGHQRPLPAGLLRGVRAEQLPGVADHADLHEVQGEGLPAAQGLPGRVQRAHAAGGERDPALLPHARHALQRLQPLRRRAAAAAVGGRQPVGAAGGGARPVLRLRLAAEHLGRREGRELTG